MPIIIYGTRGITYSKGSGQFHCPACSSRRDYRKRRVRRFFTLYFVPLIPLDLLGEYVECQACKGTYEDTVLSYDPEKQKKAFELEFHKAMRKVMVLMLLADGAVEDAEIESIRSIYKNLANVELLPEDVRREIAHLQATGTDVTKALAEVAPMLNGNGKAMVVKAAFLVAASDGHFADEEKALLVSIGKALEMGDEELSAVLASMTEG